MGVSKAENVPVSVVGSSQFGIYPKIDLSKTFNMFISDGWMVNYAGYQKVFELETPGQGRGLFNSVRGGFMIVVIAAVVYRLNPNLIPIPIGVIGTFQGDVFIDENLDFQICIVDGVNAYIYNYSDSTFTLQTLGFFPSYVSYHDRFFLFGSSPTNMLTSQNWYVYEFSTPSTISPVADFPIATKPDVALVVERLPGRGNNILVVGSTVAEIWTHVEGPEIYRRVQSNNIDYGVVSISTLAASEDWICFLSQNENNAPSILKTNGSDTTKISTDGIDGLLGTLKYPSQSTAFFFRQDGHLFYQLTFYNPADNLSLMYDFTTSMFFHLTDEHLNFHIARHAAYFDENTYFVSITDGALYNMGSQFVTYNHSTVPESIGNEIPRIRICKAIRKDDSSRFRAGEFTFWLEQGVTLPNPPTPARIDMSMSKNGGQSFSNVVSKEMNPQGIYRNQVRFWRLGQANELIIQLRWYGFQRIVCNNGQLSMY